MNKVFALLSVVALFVGYQAGTESVRYAQGFFIGAAAFAFFAIAFELRARRSS